MKRMVFICALTLLSVLVSALPAHAADDTIVFGAAISLTGKTAKEGGYTRDGKLGSGLEKQLNRMRRDGI